MPDSNFAELLNKGKPHSRQPYTPGSLFFNSPPQNAGSVPWCNSTRFSSGERSASSFARSAGVGGVRSNPDAERAVFVSVIAILQGKAAKNAKAANTARHTPLAF